MEHFREPTIKKKKIVHLSHSPQLILTPSLSVHVSLLNSFKGPRLFTAGGGSFIGTLEQYLVRLRSDSGPAAGLEAISSFCLADPCCTSQKMKGGRIRLG